MSPFTPATPPAIQNELDAGERVLWTAQPDPTRLKQRARGTAIMGALAFAFMLFWLCGASTPLRTQLGRGVSPDLNAILFPAFGLIGLGFTFLLMLAPWLEGAKSPRTFYALTDKRALIVVGTKIKSVAPSEFSLQRNDTSNGRGDLILKREVRGGGRNRTVEEIGFFGIENAREVERLARQLAQRS